jgi:hypothetical protein
VAFILTFQKKPIPFFIAMIAVLMLITGVPVASMLVPDRFGFK